MASPSNKHRLVFLLGIMPRSGTNFLANLLKIHPDCAVPERVWEDYTLAHAQDLLAYSRRVTGHWDAGWGVTDDDRSRFRRDLGQSIVRFLTCGNESHLTVSKTPSVENLALYFELFPEIPLLILVRDGRAIVESGIRSFGWRRESALHWLADRAETIRAFDRRFSDCRDRYRIVRYEDLFEDPVGSMQELLAFLNLDTRRYDFEQASHLPVRGSSEIVAKKGQLHWDPVERNAEFDPLSRHVNWTGFMHYRYRQVAGEAMEALGYNGIEQIRIPLLWRVRSLLLDGLNGLKTLVRRLQSGRTD